MGSAERRMPSPGAPAPFCHAAPHPKLAHRGDAFLHAVVGLRLRLEVPHTLRDFGVDTAQRDKIGDMAIVDPTAGGNPVELTKARALDIFDRAYEGRV